MDSKDINIQKRVKLLGSTGNELRAQRRTCQQRVMTMQDKIRRFVVRDPEVEEAKSREALLKLTREREKKAMELVAAAADRSAAIVDWPPPRSAPRSSSCNTRTRRRLSRGCSRFHAVRERGEGGGGEAEGGETGGGG